MSPRAAALVRLYSSIIVLALPGIVSLFLSSKITGFAGAITFAMGVAGYVYHAYQTAIGDQPKDGDAGSGPQGEGADVTQKTKAPASPFVSRVALGAAMLMSVCTASGCAWFKANGATVVSDVGVIAACVIEAAFATPTTSPAQIASQCGAATVQDVMAILDELLSKEQLSDSPDPVRVARLTALGADASRAHTISQKHHEAR